jgi:hypothetical protein
VGFDEYHEIGDEHERQRLEDAGDQRERATDDEQPETEPRKDRPQQRRTGVQKVHAVSDRDQIGGDVEDVGADHRDDERAKQPATLIETHRCQLAQRSTRGERRAITDLLHGRHERQGR